MKILLDTNFLIHAAEKKLDIDSLASELITSDIEWIVPQEVLNELGNLKDTAGVGSTLKKNALLSFQILKSLSPTIVELGGKNPHIDMRIVSYVLDKDIVVATMDKALKDRLGKKILTIRSGKKLELI